MKKLQNCFTTPEQSKRLIELGVPVDSADCKMAAKGNNISVYASYKFDKPLSEWLSFTQECTGREVELPCWSVGRLIEIIKICSVDNFFIPYGSTLFNWNTTLGETVIEGLINEMEFRYKHLDFSKLEE